MDDAQAYSEPSTLVPLVYASPNQVVLLGDAQQCAMQVCSDRARRLGLERSLFHRYLDEAVHMTSHLRMVQQR